ncbi:MAG: GTPase [Archaeoglobales archaeon]|nr:MAG: GTPase [Archaeoglobales archaeon]
MNIVVVGPAGSGKSTFVRNFSEYLRDYDVKVVNLDPASDPIYSADRDVRDFVRTEDVIKSYRLGINGALMKSIDLTLNYIDKLIVKGDYVIFDTPGQMELFLYSRSGLKIAEEISKYDWSVCLFIIDSEIASTPENFASIVAQNAVISLRFSMPTITIFNKCDLIDLNLNEVFEGLRDVGGVFGEIVERLMALIDYTTLRFRIVKISALKEVGFDDVLSVINEVFCSCGDIS